MFSSKVFSIWLLNIYVTYAPDVINVCFRIFGHFQVEINIPIHRELPFIPDDLKLVAILKENTYTSNIGILQKTSYILKKANHSCEEYFIYSVPFSNSRVLILEIRFVVGIEEFELDKVKTVMKSNFQESSHVLGGVYEHIWIGVNLIHGQIPLSSNSDIQLELNTESDKRIRSLLPEESYCLKVFTREFKETLVFSQNSFEDSNVSKNFILHVGAYLDFFDKIFLIKIYFTQIFPCLITEDFKDIWRVFIDPSMQGIAFRLYNENSDFLYISDYSDSSGVLTRRIRVRNFEYVNLQVKKQQVTKHMVQAKVGFLLYAAVQYTIKCETRIPQRIDDLLTSYYIEMKEGDVVVQTFFRVVDMGTQHLHVYNVRQGKTEELRKCKRR